MGRRGPKPKPSALKLLEGTYRPDRARNEPKPELVSEVVAPPAWLSREGAAVWRRAVPVLMELQLLSVLDLDALGAYCAQVGRAKKAEALLRRHGLTVEVKGRLQRRPEIAIAKEAWAEARRWAQEFGLTPAARTRLEVPQTPAIPGEEESEDAKYFGK